MQITQGNWQARINPERGSLGLTRTEAVDLMLLAAGNTYKEIARTTGRSPETVRGGLKKGYHKLDAYKAASAVAMKPGGLDKLACHDLSSLTTVTEYIRAKREDQEEILKMNDL